MLGSRHLGRWICTEKNRKGRAGNEKDRQGKATSKAFQEGKASSEGFKVETGREGAISYKAVELKGGAV
jgi:hypothetical protein